MIDKALLKQFYQAADDDALIAAQAEHIARLQTALNGMRKAFDHLGASANANLRGRLPIVRAG